ncbi:TPA: hypothetical protein RQK52_002394 [Vibrio vulnificus]|nr:hypothetical protein [Vibrio vulnificus]
MNFEKLLSSLVLSFFIIVSLNSLLKIIYFSEVWNFLGIILSFIIIVIVFIDKKRINFNHFAFTFIVALIILMIIYISVLKDFSSIDYFSIFKFLALLVFLLTASLSSRFFKAERYSKFIVFVAIIALLVYVIRPTGFYSENTNYLMFTSVICYAYVILINSNFNSNLKVILSIAFIIGILTLQSRSAILLLIIFTLIKLGKVCYDLRSLMFVVLLYSGVAVFGVVFFLNLSVIIEYIPVELGYGIFKLLNMISGDYSDARSTMYTEAFSWIVSNPFGYGFNAHNRIIGFYPHNILLETGLNYGIFLALFYLTFFVYAFFKYHSLKDVNCVFPISYMYFFCVWLTSFDYLSSFQIHMFLGSLLYLLFSRVINEKDN